jgi:putative ABC transport system permease protein
MLFRILRKSLSKRKSRVAIAIISVIMGAAMASALLTVSWQVEEKVAQELTKYGPNMVVVPKTEELTVEVGGIPLSKIGETKYISETNAQKVRGLSQDDFSGKVLGTPNKNAFLYAVVNITQNGDSNQIILSGTWFDELRKINTWWDIDGKYPDDNSSIIIGKTASEKLDIGIGDDVLVEYRETIITESGEYELYNSMEFSVVGIVSTGGEDDSRIFGDLDVVQNLTNKENKVNIMHISAVCNACPVDEIALLIEDNVPDIKVTTVKQVEKATMQILEDINSMMFLITVVALLASALGVMTTMTTSVVERTKEIGMMKAIGAEDHKIATLFLSEAIIIGIIGGILGYIVGIILAQYIGESVFNSAISPVFMVLPIILGISIGVTILSSVLPVRRAIRIEPAEVIRTV